ncbi:MAG TPA: hypothetical protein VH256_07650 [Thermoleophilaceae bacterium]|jgi:hypothetical protein|nr:hypothetical protein [Thermoleophilaceae bacterium]
MSVHTTASRETYAPPSPAAYDEDRGAGWVSFAGILLLMVGTLNIIEGIAAIDKASFFASNAHYIAGDLSAWGWTVLFIGIAEILVGLGIFAKNQFARWVGVLVLGLNAIAQLMFIPAYPFWSLAIFTLDILAIYGLVAYGARVSRAV